MNETAFGTGESSDRVRVPHSQERRKPIAPSFVGAALLAACVACTPGVALGASFRGLGFLPGGDATSTAIGISADGTVVVGIAGSQGVSEVFRWTTMSGMQQLTSSNDEGTAIHGSRVSGVSADGSMVVGEAAVTPGTGFLWTADGGLQSISEIVGSGFDFRVGRISDDGSTIVGQADFGEAFRLIIGTGIEGLGTMVAQPVSSSFALDVSADGSVVVGAGISQSRFQEAFRWTSDRGMQGLGDLPGGRYSAAAGVSADGQVVVGMGNLERGDLKYESGSLRWLPDTAEAFRWTEAGGMQGLGHLPGGVRYSIAWDVSGDGDVVVGVSDSARGHVAFIWDPVDGMRSLQEVLTHSLGLAGALDGWFLESANAITPDGQHIIGSGINPSGNREAWMARITSADPVPLPATVGMLASACLGVGAASRSRRRLGAGATGS